MAQENTIADDKLRKEEDVLHDAKVFERGYDCGWNICEVKQEIQHHRKTAFWSIVTCTGAFVLARYPILTHPIFDKEIFFVRRKGFIRRHILDWINPKHAEVKITTNYYVNKYCPGCSLFTGVSGLYHLNMWRLSKEWGEFKARSVQRKFNALQIKDHFFYRVH